MNSTGWNRGYHTDLIMYIYNLLLCYGVQFVKQTSHLYNIMGNDGSHLYNIMGLIMNDGSHLYNIMGLIMNDGSHLYNMMGQ